MTSWIISGILGGFVLGYFISRMDFLYVVLKKIHGAGSLVMESREKPTSFFEKEKHVAKQSAVKEKLGKIDIDTRTVVTKIDTETIQKGSDVELGRTTAHEDTINASVSKLAQLKGK
jgi:carbamoylphosphate synthase small subunit